MLWRRTMKKQVLKQRFFLWLNFFFYVRYYSCLLHKCQPGNFPNDCAGNHGEDLHDNTAESQQAGMSYIFWEYLNMCWMKSWVTIRNKHKSSRAHGLSHLNSWLLSTSKIFITKPNRDSTPHIWDETHTLAFWMNLHFKSSDAVGLKIKQRNAIGKKLK